MLVTVELRDESIQAGQELLFTHSLEPFHSNGLGVCGESLMRDLGLVQTPLLTVHSPSLQKGSR